jgi:hypothetical protein
MLGAMVAPRPGEVGHPLGVPTSDLDLRLNLFYERAELMALS